MSRRGLRKSNSQDRDINFQYAIDYKYDTYRDCDAAGCDGICRCTQLVDPHIEEVSMMRVANTLLHHLPRGSAKRKDPVFLYCLERFASRLQENDFLISVARGYYGEEVCGIYLSDDTKAKQLLSLETSRELVEFILTLEYGYVLETLEGKNWIVGEVDLKSIRVPAEYRKLDQRQIQRCREIAKETKLLSCLTTREYKLIDGYHRYRASVEEGLTSIKVIHPE